MKIQIPLSLRQLNGTEAYFQKDKFTLCDWRLADFFEFPKKSPSITITLSTERTENSYEVKMESGFCTMQIHYDGDWHSTTMYYKAKNLVRNLSEKWNVETLFVSLDY